VFWPDFYFIEWISCKSMDFLCNKLIFWMDFWISFKLIQLSEIRFLNDCTTCISCDWMDFVENKYINNGVYLNFIFSEWISYLSFVFSEWISCRWMDFFEIKFWNKYTTLKTNKHCGSVCAIPVMALFIQRRWSQQHLVACNHTFISPELLCL